MGRITIADLPRDHKVSRDEMRKIIGGASLMTRPHYITSWGIPQTPILTPWVAVSST